MFTDALNNIHNNLNEFSNLALCVVGSGPFQV